MRASLTWIAAAALIVSCGAVSALMVWIATFVASPADAVHAKEPHVLRAAKCLECGVVQSVEEIETQGEHGGSGAAKSYDVTVRLYTGKIRVFTAAGMHSWRSGEKIMVIDGIAPPNVRDRP